MEKHTLDDIARITGYSKTTVSRVLNGKAASARISKQAVEKIMKVSKDTGYQLNSVAQMLRSKVSKTIGLVVPYISNPFFANLASTVITNARQAGYIVTLIDTMENPEAERQALNTMVARSVDGIIVVPCGDDPATIASLCKRVPLILIDRYYPEADIPYVSTDNYDGGYRAMQLLLESGHNRVLCIKGPDVSVTSNERVRGCHDAIAQSGNNCRLSVVGNDFSVQNGYIETQLAISAKQPPTAIFALSSTILLGVLKALNEHKLNIPDDVSVISFDDNTYLDYLNPPVTRIKQPVTDIAETAINLLIQAIAKKEQLQANICMAPSIVLRNSIKHLH